MNLAKSLFVFLLILFFNSCKKKVDFNDVPVADAGNSQTITMPSSLTLTGSGTDGDGHIVAYLWSQVSGPVSTTIVNPGSPSTAVLGFTAGNYIFQLMVTDNEGATGVDTVSVKVNPSPIQTLTLQPANNPNEKMIIAVGSSDNSMFGGNEWIVDAWTVGGQNFIGRSIFKFDLSQIPSSATILTANLLLYSNTPPENGNLVDANFGANNGLALKRITSNWNPSSTNWHTQPSTTDIDQVLIPSTTQSVQDLNINVKNLVTTMVANTNYGFLLKLQDETPYKSRAFVSSHHASKSSKHPKLVITYQP